MQVRTHNILALALASALLSPMAMAEKGGNPAGAAVRGNAMAQAVPATPAVPAQPETGEPAVPAVPAQPATPHDVVPDVPVGGREVPEAARRSGDKAVDSETNMDAEVDANAQAETRAAPPSRVARDAVFGALDSDGDGSISTLEAEADADFQARFSTIDGDGDGIVTDAEYKAFAKTQVPPAPPAQAQGAAHAAGHSSVVQRGTFAPLDADADGRISLAEAAADADFNAGFAMMDGDGDGFVTDAEFRAHAKADDGATP